VSMPPEILATELPGVLEIRTKAFGDARGFFTEAYNQAAWAEAGFQQNFVQDNLSCSSRGTLRGLHYQIRPHAMGKLVRALRGSMFDVAVDLRRGSPTFGGWIGRLLRGDTHNWLYVPPGFAHGFIALEDDTLLYYKCTASYCPEAERTLRYDDPRITIEWPIEATVLADKDRAAPGLDEAEFNFVYEA